MNCNSVIISLNFSRVSFTLILLFFFFSISLSAQKLVDASATPSTNRLYKALFNIQKKGVVFGHQDDMAYGVGWKYVKGQSDIKSVVGEYPGLYGWDIAYIESDSVYNIDGVPFQKMRQFIVEGYNRGGLITVSWHAPNPFTGGSAWDTTKGTVASILPGGAKHQLYINWLNSVSSFLQSLQTKDGQLIPVLFRPFHELTGNWFWWCKNVSTPAEFIQLWQFTVSYLRDIKQLHHLIYVYNTADFNSDKEFLERYPGDEWVDVLSFDRYQFDGPDAAAAFKQVVTNQLSILSLQATLKNKPAAIAETGFEAIPDSFWWTQTLYPLLKKHTLSYVLVWRNHGYMPATNKMHYYAPYPNQRSAIDFKKFSLFPDIFFEKGVRSFNVYQ